jgi:hypothetical protein
MEAASRETLEETGIDVSDHIVEEGALHYIYIKKKNREGNRTSSCISRSVWPCGSTRIRHRRWKSQRVRWAPIELLGTDFGGVFQADGPTKALLGGIQRFIAGRASTEFHKENAHRIMFSCRNKVAEKHRKRPWPLSPAHN